MNPDQQFALIMAFMFGLVLPIALAIVIPWAWARSRKSSGLPQLDEQSIRDLDMLKDRVADLEERLDFTERLLAEARDRIPLAPAHGADR